MVKVSNKNGLAWKPLSLKSRVLSHSLDLDGLIGVEELTDYRLDKKNNTVVIGAPKESTQTPTVKDGKIQKKKKNLNLLKKKLKQKETSTVQESEADELIDTGDSGEEKVSAVVAEPSSKKLKRKQKNKFLKNDNKNNTVVIGAPKESTKTPTVKDGKSQKKKKNKEKKKKNLLKKKLKRKEISTVQESEADEQIDSGEEKVSAVVAEPLSKKLKRKQKNKFLKNDNVSADDLSEKMVESDEPFTKKLKQKKKKKQTYLSVKSALLPADGDINENVFVEMAEWVKFNIPETIIKALHEKGFTNPTKIQSLVLPAALLAKKDIVGAAETGSGKTLAFGIPILAGIVHHLENPQEEEDNDSGLEDLEEGKIAANTTDSDQRKRNKLYALILAPTRELAIQVQNHILDAGKYTPVKVACVVGGMSTEKQLRILNQCPHILVATPGRLWEFVQLGHFHLKQLYRINYLVIDETDRMIESGHFPELKNILDRVTMTETSQPRQTFVFSATLTHTLKHSLNLKKDQSKSKKPSKSDPNIKKLQDLLKIKSPKIVDITERVGLTKTLTESKIFCKHDEKDSYLYYFILQHPGRTLVFCNSICSVKRMTQLLTMLKCSPLPLHASMNQRQRLKNLDRFRAESNGILLATDVAARGLDIPGIEHVIHYHVPRTSEIYIHRSGRTARANNEGLTVVFVESDEIPLYIKMFNSLEKKIDLPDFPIDEAFLSLANKRIELAKSIEFLESKIKKNRPDSWLEKAANDMDIIIDDENLIQPKESSRENKLMSKALAVKRRELQTLLSKNIQSSQCNVNMHSALNAVKHAVEDVKEEKKLALKKRNKHKRKFKRKKKAAEPNPS